MKTVTTKPPTADERRAHARDVIADASARQAELSRSVRRRLARMRAASEAARRRRFF